MEQKAVVLVGETLPTAPVRLDENPAAIYLAGLSPQGRRTQLQALDTIARMLGAADARSCPWAQVRYAHAAAIRSRLQEQYAPATANKMLSALRRVMKECRRLGQVDAETVAQVCDVENVRGSTLPAGRAITPGELGALLRVCSEDPTPAGARDAALLALLYGCGIRRAELVALAVEDYRPAGEVLVVKHGKGRKEREVPVTSESGTAAALADWLLVRGTEPGPLFVPVNKGGRMELRPLSDQAVFLAVNKRAEQAGVDALSPHDFRRTFVSDLLDAGADIATVQKLAGHASVNTTARYDRRGDAAKRKAVALLHVPYQRRRLGL